MKKLYGLSACALLLTLTSPASAVEPWPAQRNGLLAGGNIGSGSLNVNMGAVDTERRESVVLQLRLGYAVMDELYFSIESYGWTRSFEQFEDLNDATWTVFNIGLGATYFPGNSGFFVRCALGLGVTYVDFWLDQPQPGIQYVKSSETATGPSLLFATGYEWRLTRRLGLAGQFDFNHQFLGDQNFGTTTMKSSSFYSISLGLNYYL